MKAEYKRLNKEFNELVSEIPVDELKKIYYERSYDSIRTLWIDKDAEGYKQKETDIMKFIEKMNYHQRRVCMLKKQEHIIKFYMIYFVYYEANQSNS